MSTRKGAHDLRYDLRSSGATLKGLWFTVCCDLPRERGRWVDGSLLSRSLMELVWWWASLMQVPHHFVRKFCKNHGRNRVKARTTTTTMNCTDIIAEQTSRHHFRAENCIVHRPASMIYFPAPSTVHGGVLSIRMILHRTIVLGYFQAGTPEHFFNQEFWCPYYRRISQKHWPTFTFECFRRNFQMPYSSH